jgi:diketogulonate reductase-like aldo/keto reductase
MNTGLTTDSGIHLPPIIYGTAWKKERTAALVEQALTLGFRGIDTAGQPKHYDEAGVGLGLAQAIKAGVDRKDIYLQTKFTPLDGQDPKRVPYDPKASLTRQVEQSFAQSLQNLRADYVDGLVLHSPLPKREELIEVWTAMESIVDAGNARLLGISNCYELERLEDLYASARINPLYYKTGFMPTQGMTGKYGSSASGAGLFISLSGHSRPIPTSWHTHWFRTWRKSTNEQPRKSSTAI